MRIKKSNFYCDIFHAAQFLRLKIPASHSLAKKWDVAKLLSCYFSKNQKGYLAVNIYYKQGTN